MSEALQIAIVGGLGVLLGTLVTSALQLMKWRGGEKKNTDASTSESYARAASTAVDTNTKLLTQINDVSEQLTKALARIEALEKKDEKSQERMKHLEDENDALRKENRKMQKELTDLKQENSELRTLLSTNNPSLAKGQL